MSSSDPFYFWLSYFYLFLFKTDLENPIFIFSYIIHAKVFSKKSMCFRLLWRTQNNLMNTIYSAQSWSAEKSFFHQTNDRNDAGTKVLIKLQKLLIHSWLTCNALPTSLYTHNNGYRTIFILYERYGMRFEMSCKPAFNESMKYFSFWFHSVLVREMSWTSPFLSFPSCTLIGIKISSP